MPETRVIVAAPRPLPREAQRDFPQDLDDDHDLSATFIRDQIRSRGSDMVLVEDRIVDPAEVPLLLRQMPQSASCALIMVGPPFETDETAHEAFESAVNLVALVSIVGGIVRIWARRPGLSELVEALQQLATTGEDRGRETRHLPVIVEETGTERPEIEDERTGLLQSGESELGLDPGWLLEASRIWIHELLRAAAGRLFTETRNGLESTRVPIKDWMDKRGASTPLKLENRGLSKATKGLATALSHCAQSDEPLARLWRGLGLDEDEFHLAILALGPELDVRNQNWITLLMDDPGRRVGTLALYEELLRSLQCAVTGIPRADRLAKWRLFDGVRDVLPPADVPLRLDPPLRAWLLGDRRALEEDPALEGLLTDQPWPGSLLVAGEHRGRQLMEEIEGTGEWAVLAGNGAGPSAWRAMLDAGASANGRSPVRADLGPATSLSPLESWDAGLRLARLVRLTGRPLIIDVGNAAEGNEADAVLRSLLTAVGTAGDVRGAIIAAQPARICRLLGLQKYRIEKEAPSADGRLTALSRAASKTGAEFTREAAESLANLYPLQIDGVEQAMLMARSRPLGAEPDAAETRFITACKEVSAEGSSGLAQRIEPIFDLVDVVLPEDRKDQLEEIVDNIQYAPKVLEGWKFRDQLPYGLGVTALFHGPSGTGKTMASMAVAKALGIQLLKIDLSRVVSKYIGDTEKNIDRVFQEAQTSGAALVIDEADGLLARRGEVKDAHDRYANLEVAYLLQRMETFEGLAILTTNLRQNVDSAFLRRLRFIVDFPRPDAVAREEIWRRCLPEESHLLSDATFRALGRRVELTGGSIRQITLRAAFLAAAAHSKIGPEHITHAVNAEFAKLGMPAIDLDLLDRRAAA